jgi:hypothetical protein
MREIAMAFICFAGVLVLSFWGLAILLAIKSGKGILALFTQQRKNQWLSAADTIALYGSDHTNTTD